MILQDIAQLLEAKIACGEQFLNREISHAFASDLMSDVLTVNSANLLLLTGLTNIQTIRTSEMSDVTNIVLVRDKHATEEMINLAEENGIVILESPFSMFRASGILYEAGLKPVY